MSSDQSAAVEACENGWRPVPEYTEYRGKALPYLAIHHPSYFFFCRRYYCRWGLGRIGETTAKARTILVAEGKVVVYRFHRNLRTLDSVGLVDREDAQEYEQGLVQCLVRPYLDLSIIKHVSEDKASRFAADEVLKNAFRRIVCGDPGYRLTEKRCQRFFDNDSNFAARPGTQSGGLLYRHPSWERATIPGCEGYLRL